MNIIVPIGGTGLCITFDEIEKTDSEIADAIKAEMERQNSHIELIASENWVSKAGHRRTDGKYRLNGTNMREGYPGKEDIMAAASV